MGQILKIILFAVIFAFLAIATSDNIQAQQLNDKGSNELPFWSQILISIAGGAVSGSLITHFIGPWMKEKYKLREIYLVPYKEWCGDMYGEVLEFEHLCKHKHTLSDDYIVFHFWEIHNTVRHGHKWMGKIKKDPFRWRI
jgi:hypothetical protein